MEKISNKLRTELAKKVKLGSTTDYFARNDPKNTKTMTDNSELEQALKTKQYLGILQAIYDVSSDSKFNGRPYAISKEGSSYKITDIKNAESGKITIKWTNNVLKVSDPVTKTTTTIELSGVIETQKAVTKPFKDQIEDILKNNKKDEDIINALKNVIKNKKV